MGETRITFGKNVAEPVILLEGKICGKIQNAEGCHISSVTTGTFLLLKEDEVEQIARKVKELNCPSF